MSVKPGNSFLCGLRAPYRVCMKGARFTIAHVQFVNRTRRRAQANAFRSFWMVMTQGLRFER